MNTEEKDMRKVLTHVAEKCKLKKWRYERNDANWSILNYGGNLFPITIEDEESSQFKYVIVKSPPSTPPSEELDKVIRVTFEGEVYMYNILIPIFKTLKTNINFDEILPHCYYADSTPGNRILVLEDMRPHGFERHDHKYLDFDHMNVSLKSIAEFHSLSIILDTKSQKLPQSHPFRSYISTNDRAFYGAAVASCFQKHLPLFHNKQFKVFLNEVNSRAIELIDESVLKARRLVYGHGDFWKENMLFKYADKVPVKACLLDYQCSRLLSPAQDVLFLIMTATETSDRQKHYSTYISTYYHILQEVLHKNGLDVHLEYPKVNFYHDLKVVFPMCFLVTYFSFSLWLGLDDMESCVLRRCKIIPDQQKEKIQNEFRKVIEDLLADFKAFDFINQ